MEQPTILMKVYIPDNCKFEICFHKPLNIWLKDKVGLKFDNSTTTIASNFAVELPQFHPYFNKCFAILSSPFN